MAPPIVVSVSVLRSGQQAPQEAGDFLRELTSDAVQGSEVGSVKTPPWGLCLHLIASSLCNKSSCPLPFSLPYTSFSQLQHSPVFPPTSCLFTLTHAHCFRLRLLCSLFSFSISLLGRLRFYLSRKQNKKRQKHLRKGGTAYLSVIFQGTSWWNITQDVQVLLAAGHDVLWK